MSARKIILEGTDDQLKGISIPAGVRATDTGRDIEILKGGGRTAMADYCPECHKKDIQKEFIARDHKEELEKLTAETAAVKAQLTEALKKPAEAEPPHPPPSQALFTEWENCSNCRGPFMQYRQKVAADALKIGGYMKAPRKITIVEKA